MTQIFDVLEHIERINSIQFEHEKAGSEEDVVRQYDRLKENFLKQLQDLLAEYKISAHLKPLAA